tara:strand:- start:1243 stop:1485 length:243 start_codon:yes stop_codon:yes gene_type:complete
MTLNQIFKITGVISTKRKLPIDMVNLLDEEYYSESRDDYIKYGDMDLIHFIRAMKKYKVAKWKPMLSEEFKKAINELKVG